MKTFVLCMFLSCFVIFSSEAQNKTRFDRGIVKRTFVPKGQWFAGGTLSYAEADFDSYKFLVVNGMKGDGYSLTIKPFVGYMFANDLGAGLSLSYERTLVKIDNLDLNISEDFEFNISDYYVLEHLYTASAFVRVFMNIEESKRFGLFNDVKLLLGGGQGKYVNGTGNSLEGTYQQIFKYGLVYSPGVVVFINDYAAVEVSVGVLGLTVKDVKQKTNQVYTGSYHTMKANFKIDLLSLGLGISLYL